MANKGDNDMKNNKYGFTIIETMLSMSIIFVLWFTIFSLFSFVRQGLHLSETHYNAAFLGKSLLNDANSLPFNEVIPLSGSQTLTGTYNGASFNQIISYNIFVEVIASNKKRVWAVMNWREPSGNKQVVLETIIVR